MGIYWFQKRLKMLLITQTPYTKKEKAEVANLQHEGHNNNRDE